MAACQQGCATRPGLAETDRASCKLQCTSKRRAAQIRTEGLREEASGTRPRTVPPTSVDPSRYVTTEPPPHTTGGGVYTTVVESAKSPGEIAACQIGCDQAGLGSTDRATCKLNCAATTRIIHVVPAAPSPTAAGGQSIPASAPAPTYGSGLQACYDGCAHRPGSDRATCRLNCESSHRVRSSTPATPTSSGAGRTAATGPAPGASVVHRPTGDHAAAAACEQACDRRSDLSVTDRSTCKLGCSRHTTVVVEQWTSTAPTPASECAPACACKDRCAGHEAACARGCADKQGGNAATCRLQCEASFNSCTNACRATGCSCGPPPN